jgi:DNA-binding NarL/FixJ family response regulator
MNGVRQAKSRVRRILVVDDHPMVRERLAEAIQGEADLMVCGEAEDHLQALKAAASTRPDLIIVDLSLKQSHGLDLIKELRVRHPTLPALVLSMHDDSLHAERVIRAGARGYINKQEATRKVVQAVRTVLVGGFYLSEKMNARLAGKLAGRATIKAGLAVDTLTDRELRVFELIGSGKGTRQIAGELKLDMRTIETYRARIKAKLHLKDADELLQHAIHWTQNRR